MFEAMVVSGGGEGYAFAIEVGARKGPEYELRIEVGVDVRKDGRW